MAARVILQIIFSGEASMTNSTIKESIDELKLIAKERTVRTQSFDIDLETLNSKIRKQTYRLDPDYQRRRRWSVENSSRLIESLLLNIPVPTVYISLDIDPDSKEADMPSEDSRFTVIDGQQRLSAISSFFNDNFSLQGLEVLEPLNGCKYSELQPFLKRRLEDRTIRCLQVDSTIDSQVKYDIFERLNTGSVKLEAQEIRNCVYRGPFNDFIKELAKDPKYLCLINLETDDLDQEKRYQKMEDVELVLRFFAMREFLNFRSDFRKFLDFQQESLNRIFTAKIGETFRAEFKEILFYLENNFGPLPFAKWKVDDDGHLKKSSNFNAAVFDAVVIGIFMSKNKFNSSVTYEDFKELFRDEDFFTSVDVSTNRPISIQTRIQKVRELFDK